MLDPLSALQDTDPLNINLKPDPPITYIGAPIHRRWLKRDSDRAAALNRFPKY